MKSLTESILDRLEESILSTNNAGILSKIKDNLEYCNDIKEFSKLWTSLGLDVNGFHWGQYAGKDSYTYVNDYSRFLVYCTKHMIVIYNDLPELWEDYKEFRDYCNKVADVLKMKKYLSRTQKGDQCILT